MNFELKPPSAAWYMRESISLNYISSQKVQPINAEVQLGPAKRIGSLESEIHREVPNDRWIAAYSHLPLLNGPTTIAQMLPGLRSTPLPRRAS